MCVLSVMRILMPGILVGLVLGSSASPAASKDLNSYVTAAAKKREFHGAILIQQGGRTKYAGSHGFANISFHVPSAPSTKYKIASITKAFTSVLILQLRERGRLDLGDTIEHHLPGYAGEGARRVTIHQLLNHTSGISNMDQTKSMADALQNGIPVYQSPFSPQQILEQFTSGPLVHEPGLAFSYNNGDYVILGRIIERLEGKPFESVLRERILAPMGMSDSGMLRQQLVISSLADTYFYRDDIKQLVPDLPNYPENWFAAGAMYSTAGDLAKFSSALFGERLLCRASLDLMLKPGLDDYGYGVWVHDMKFSGKPYRVMKRPGSIMGAQTQLLHILDLDLTVIILSNVGNNNLDDFVRDLAEAALINSSR